MIQRKSLSVWRAAVFAIACSVAGLAIGLSGGCGGDATVRAAEPGGDAETIGRQMVYVSVGGDGKIVAFELNRRTGELTRRSAVRVGGRLGSLAVAPDRRHLYAAVRSEGAAASLKIDPGTGALSKLGAVSIDGNAAYLSVDQTGRYLLAAYYGDGKVATYPIRDGRVISEPASVQETEKKAHASRTDPSNQFVFVPHTGPNAIYQFRFDASNGGLTANEPAKVIAPDGAGPRHYCFHPEQPVAYFVNELGSSVTAYRFDRDRGTLSAMRTLSTLPDGYDGQNWCADVHITPDGRWLYCSNRGHDSLAIFAIDPATGKLKRRLGLAETEPRPREFAIDKSGRFVYAAGKNSGKLAAYRIDARTGKLHRFATYQVGERPGWVSVVRLGE